MAEKCSNCRYISQLRQNENEGQCKDCNDENNSKNWQYDNNLNTRTKMAKKELSDKDKKDYEKVYNEKFEPHSHTLQNNPTLVIEMMATQLSHGHLALLRLLFKKKIITKKEFEEELNNKIKDQNKVNDFIDKIRRRQ